MICGCLRAFSVRNRAGFDRKSRDFACGSARFWLSRRAHRPQHVCNHRWRSLNIVKRRCAPDFERAVCCARKIHKNSHENRTCSRRFLQSFCARQVRCECAMHAEVFLDVLKMMCGISAVLQCALWLFAHIFGAKLSRFRSKIA